MEKFGIFNILSALNKLTDDANGETAAQSDAPAAPQSAPAQTPNVPTGIFTGEERMNKMLDVLARHELISKRIEKNEKTPR